MPIDASLLIKNNAAFWFERYGVIRGVNGRPVKPKMNVLQRRIFALYNSRRRAGKPVFMVGLKPRKRGFSTAVSAIVHTMLCNKSTEAVIVGNKLDTSDTVFSMGKYYADNDEFLKDGEWGSKFKATTETVKFEHGSRLSQSTAKNGDSIRGQTPQAVHGSEVGFWENEGEVLLALMNAIPDDPSAFVCLESTPNGTGGAYAKRWRESRWPKPSECPADQEDYWKQWESLCPDQPDAMFSEWEFVRVFAAWYEFEESAIRLDDEQKKHVQATLDEKSWHAGEKALIEVYGNEFEGHTRLGREVTGFDVWEQLAWRRMIIKSKCESDPKKFDQEYPRDPTTAFLSSGNPVFDADSIAHYQTQILPPLYGALESNIPDENPVKLNERAVWRPVSVEDAIVWKWEEPRVGCSYLIDVDTMEGEDQSGGADPDRHSVLVWRRTYRDNLGTFYKTRLVARLRPPCQVPIHVLVEWVHMLSLYYGRALVVPEMNSSGLAYLTGAQLRGTNIWKRKEQNHRTGKKEEKFGWRTTDGADYTGLRTQILNNLHKVLREQSIDIHCPNLLHEIASFVRNGRKMEAGTGEHDDDVMSASIGLFNIDAATTYGEEMVMRRIPKDLEDAMNERTPETGRAQIW